MSHTAVLKVRILVMFLLSCWKCLFHCSLQELCPVVKVKQYAQHKHTYMYNMYKLLKRILLAAVMTGAGEDLATCKCCLNNASINSATTSINTVVLHRITDRQKENSSYIHVPYIQEEIHCVLTMNKWDQQRK